MLQVEQGDITRVRGCDAIVSAANPLGEMTTGVAGAIARAAPPVQDELRTLCASRRYYPGEVIITGAGGLGARYVLHAVTVARPGWRTELLVVERCLDSLLAAARELGLACIALPAIAMGIGTGRVDREAVAELYARKLPAWPLTVRVVDLDHEWVAHLRRAVAGSAG